MDVPVLSQAPRPIRSFPQTTGMFHESDVHMQQSVRQSLDITDVLALKLIPDTTTSCNCLPSSSSPLLWLRAHLPRFKMVCTLVTPTYSAVLRNRAMPLTWPRSRTPISQRTAFSTVMML